MTNEANDVSSMDERAKSRLPILREVILNGPTLEQCRACATDISEAGCRIAVPTHINTGAFVTVEFEQSITGQGWVAWSTAGVIGVDFVVPMSPQAVARLTNGNSGEEVGDGAVDTWS